MRKVLHAEWTKARTVRSTTLTPLVMALLTPALAVFVGLTGSLHPTDSVFAGSLTGSVPAQITAGIFGVLVVSGEYGTRMIDVTFAACPRRGRVLLAKALLAAAVTFVIGLASCAAAYGLGTLLLADRPQGEPMPALAGVALCFAAATLLGLALGALLRHSAGAITAVIGLMLVPSLFGPLFGDLQRWITGAAPPAPLQKLIGISDASAAATGSLGGWPSLALLLAYSLLALAAAVLVVRRRDA
ncbi:ABC transporter permease [Actinomadura craniellae]|uniref:ABC transporter permease n=1 Tax=Actinomadura craniellae TaxID=2231787 RepID=A0A365H6C7_9ACTN|nr:ABC transporter permease subunit [Actinomadura craniellae]RAY14588.1 ABC transporter permease [Actinomadura craniellae]